jgi:hypothetical protein
MSSFDDFLRESRVYDDYDSFTADQKLEWRKLYEQSRTAAPATGIPQLQLY